MLLAYIEQLGAFFCSYDVAPITENKFEGCMFATPLSASHTQLCIFCAGRELEVVHHWDSTAKRSDNTHMSKVNASC